MDKEMYAWRSLFSYVTLIDLFLSTSSAPSQWCCIIRGTESKVREYSFKDLLLVLLVKIVIVAKSTKLAHSSREILLPAFFGQKLV